jgi:drug/metabolite transporter (DMT)-like permease
MKANVRGSIEMSVAMMISGTIGWLVVLSGRSATEVVFWRCVFGAAILLPACAVLGHLRPGQVSRRQLMLAALGGVAVVANWLLLFAAYPRASISIATAVYNTQPFMLAGLGALFLKERLTPGKLACLLVSFAGVLMIVQAQPAGTGGGRYLEGILLALGAAFFYALAALVAKRLKGVPPHLIALVQVLVGATLLLLPAGVGDGVPMTSEAWTFLATIGVVHTGLMFTLMYSAIQRLPTYLTGALSFIYPVVAFLVDAWAFGHRLHPVQIAGAAGILLAAAAMMLCSLRQPKLAPQAGQAPDGGCEPSDQHAHAGSDKDRSPYLAR